MCLHWQSANQVIMHHVTKLYQSLHHESGQKCMETATSLVCGGTILWRIVWYFYTYLRAAFQTSTLDVCGGGEWRWFRGQWVQVLHSILCFLLSQCCNCFHLLWGVCMLCGSQRNWCLNEETMKHIFLPKNIFKFLTYQSDIEMKISGVFIDFLLLLPKKQTKKLHKTNLGSNVFRSHLPQNILKKRSVVFRM